MTWYSGRRDSAGNLFLVKHKGNNPETPRKSKPKHSSISAHPGARANADTKAKSGPTSATAPPERDMGENDGARGEGGTSRFSSR